MNTPLTTIYVSPTGTSDDRVIPSIETPWSLTLALLSARIAPGATVYLRGGTYAGVFTSSVSGTQAQPITYRPYANETPIIDCTDLMTINASDTIWRDGIQFMHSDWPNGRQSAYNSLSPADMPWNARFQIRGPRTKLINCIFHDLAECELWEVAPDSEITGCVFFNNGFNQLSSGGVGHALYTQNDTGTPLIKHNIVVSAYNFGFHAYGSSLANLKNYHFIENIHTNVRFLVGGLGTSQVENVLIDGNLLYNSQLNVGYNATQNTSVEISNNVLGEPSASHFQLMHFLTLNVHDNLISMFNGPVVEVYYAASTSYTFARNSWYVLDGGSQPLKFETHGAPGGDATLNFAQWQALGFDAAGSFTGGRMPDSVHVFPNPYGGAHLGNVAIYNWSGASSVNVDLSSLGLVNGQSYKLRNAANYLTEWQNFTYTGAAVAVTMTGWTVATPIAAAAPLFASTFPTFGTFVVTP